MGNISIPNTFVAYTKIKSSEVNANFTAVTAVVNGSIDNTNISATAAIARSKIATGTTNHVIINDGSTGALSSEAQLASTRGGTGVNNAGTLTYGSNNITLTTGGVTSVTLPTSGTLATLAGSEVFTNKTLTTPNLDLPVIRDTTDATKHVAFSISGATTGKTTTLTFANTLDRTVTFPDQAGNVLLSGNASIVNADISTSAAIARSKIAAGTASHVVINDGSGNLSSEAQLAISRGGTGASTANTGFNALSPMTTKGDIIAYSTTAARLAVGSDSQVLTADSTQATGMKWATPASAPTQPYEMSNIGLATSVATNALTVALKQSDGSTDPSAGSPVKIGFRSSTATSGAYNQRTATAATSLTVASGATLGTTNGAAANIWVYALDNAGTVELAVSLTRFDEGSVQSTTALSGTSNSATVLYSTTARTSVPVRLLGRVNITETTAGTWASNATEIALAHSIVAAGVVATLSGTETLTNKTISGSSNTLSNIADSSLNTISTAGKVSNSATTATSANTASAIVARDGSGNFSAATITGATALLAGDGSVSANGVGFSAEAGTGIYRSNTSELSFATASTCRVRIGSGGKLLVGSVSAPANRHEFYISSTTDECIIVQNNNTTSSSDGRANLNLTKGSTTNTAGSNHFIDFNINAGATGSGYIGSNGASNAAFFATSDRRLKTNIKPLSGGLSTICSLNPVTYNWKHDQSSAVGFIAQELASVLPKQVVPSDSGEGESLPKGTTPWSMTESGFIPYLVKAIQELKAELDALKAKLPTA